jgi:predicted ester cyclase
MFAPPAPRVVVAHPAEAGKAIGVGSDEPTPGFDASAEPAAVYPRFLDALNSHDLAAAKACVDPARYRENCVGFTDGYVDWAGAKASVQTIWKGLPDLHVELHNLAAGPDFAIARGTVSGTALGRLYGAPAAKHHYQASFFDYVRLDQGRIVERVQQADLLAQMRQLYGHLLGAAGISAMLLRQHPPDRSSEPP